MLIAWLVVNVVVSTWTSHSIFVNPVIRFAVRRLGGRAWGHVLLALLVVLLVVHTAIAVALSVLVSLRAAVVLTSLMLLVSCLSVYFMNQRFAGRLERTGIVISNPLLYPSLSLAAFLACTAALILFWGWVWGVIPALLWLALGFVCAELAIRRYMARSRESGSGCDRRLAVFAINSAQGRDSLFRPQRYPFP